MKNISTHLFTIAVEVDDSANVDLEAVYDALWHVLMGDDYTALTLEENDIEPGTVRVAALGRQPR